jgi:PHD/YefM family antitoxin component YafN of YafNO toxin-antitoxin module
MSVEGFETLDANHVGSGLARLHERVVRSRGRVEITVDGTDERCVILSKSELDSLEEALGILAETDAFRAMHAQVSQVAIEHGPVGAGK